MVMVPFKGQQIFAMDIFMRLNVGIGYKIY